MPTTPLYQSSIFKAQEPTWCPGCGDFAIWNGLRQALAELNLLPEHMIIVYGIGCSGNMANTIKTYGFHSIHGRTLPVATGIRIANHNLKVLALAGDGDAYGEGLNHLAHSARENIDITYLVCNNKRYSLTTGQASPTTEQSIITKSTPFGNTSLPLNPLALAIISGATFVSRGFSGEVKHLTNLIKQAITHPGFALIDILQPCLTFNQENTYQWYQEKIYKLEDQNYAADDRIIAFSKSQEFGPKIPIGLFYQECRPTFEHQLPQLAKQTLVEQGLERDLNDLFR